MPAESRLPPFIEAMLHPEFYAHRADALELKQTHISYVVLAGDYVYKIKKPVRFAFLDYSTLEKRRHFCHEEIRLNRRLAPGIYLGVVAILQNQGQFTLSECAPKSDRVLEYAVKMRRLPEEHLLDRRVKEGKARKEDFTPIAGKLADFYAQAASAQARVYGSADAIRRNLEDNLNEVEPLIGETLSFEQFMRMRNYNDDFLTGHADLLEKRIEQGRVREGHGDLRAEHICIADDPIIFDCIEFNEKLRYCDAASEIAFLAMDLDYLGTPLLSDHLVTTFQRLTGDSELSVLLPLYKSYRAGVRGKVETLKSRETEVAKTEKDQAKIRARRYFRLASRYVKAPISAAIVVVCGLVASGKSSLARRIGDGTGYQTLNSDVVRKQLAAIPLTTRASHAYGEGIFTADFNTRTYNRLLSETEDYLKSGNGVVVDATFKDAKHRQCFLDLSRRMQLPVIFIECRAGEKKTLERLKTRQQHADEVSDATIDVYLRQRGEFMPLTDIPDSIRMVVNTESDLEKAADDALNFLSRVLGKKA